MEEAMQARSYAAYGRNLAGNPPRSGRFDAVDSLRAIAMIMVIAQHADLFPFGWLGVQLFFVISGFVVTISVLEQPDQGATAWHRLRDFYRRRIARIMPCYYVYVLLAIALTVLIGAPLETRSRLAQALFTYNFYLIAFDAKPLIPTSHLWSLSVEMQFYLLFGPVLVFARRAWLAPGLVGGIGVVTVLRLWFAFDADRLQQVDFFTPWQFDAFAAGSLLALDRAGLTTLRAQLLLLAGIGAMALFIGAYMVVNYHFGARGMGVAEKILSGNSVGQGRAAVMFTPIMLFSVGLVASAATAGTSLARWLQAPALVRIGRASYSGYLIHFLVLAMFQLALTQLFGTDWTEGRTLHGLATKAMLVAVVTPATVILAEAIYTRFELPAAKTINRWLSQPWGGSKTERVVASSLPL